MQITFNQLRLTSFKNHKDLTVDFTNTTRISGTNGAGKSSIGEAITWLLYGLDTYGNKCDPSPKTYDFEQVETHLLLTVDDVHILLGKVLPAGKPARYYINEVPKKAKEFDAYTGQLFDKRLFMSLFTPAYFFTQHWEEQREQLLQYVLPSTNKEVFAELPTPQADKLSELFRKKSVGDLYAQHKENKRKQDKALIGAVSRTKTLVEQLESQPDTAEIDKTALNAALEQIGEKLAKIEIESGKVRDDALILERLKVQIQTTYEEAKRVELQYKERKEAPSQDACGTCGQALDEETRERTKQHRQKQLDELKSKHHNLLEQYKEMKKDQAGMAVEVEPLEHPAELYEQRSEIQRKLQEIDTKKRLLQTIEEAKQNEKTIHASFTESVFILDAIKAFQGKEAELTANKMGGMFKTLTMKLLQENKGDGEQKPYFEVEMNGNPYRMLSVGEKMSAGLELVSVLSKENGIITPCLVDNAESFTSEVNASGQIIICEAVKGQRLLIDTGGFS